MKLIPVAAPLALLALSLPLRVEAAGFDGSVPLLCAAIDIVSCAPGGDCRRETAESINAPQFLAIDAAGKTVSGTRPNGEMLTTAIETVRRAEDTLVLQGTETPLTWSIVITEPRGLMTLTAAGGETAFVAFGACTQR